MKRFTTLLTAMVFGTLVLQVATATAGRPQTLVFKIGRFQSINTKTAGRPMTTVAPVPPKVIAKKSHNRNSLGTEMKVAENAIAKQDMKQKSLLRLSSKEKESEDSTTEKVSLRIVQNAAKKSHNRNSLSTEMKVSEKPKGQFSDMATTSRVLRTLGEMRQVGAATRGM
jgi:hypothetical protein